MQHNIFLYITISLEKYSLHFFENDLELQSTLSFSKYYNLSYLFRFATKFRCRLNLTMSLGFFDLFVMFLRRDLVIICLRRFLLKCFFYSLVKCVFSWVHDYLKCKQNYFQRLHGFSDLNWSLSSCLKLRYINFFGSNYSNFVFRICIFVHIYIYIYIYHMKMITQTSFKGVWLHK